ncbi:hypothetical protein EDB83DRAFT_2532495 [Lactarius deliciosus]|nr:hypothetical protein EDB83DRAFT_2532495 [Lactarius deliciosus]
MSSLIVYQGKMTAGTYMVDENLYVVFPSGIKDGALAYVLGTWTKDASGTVNSPLTMVGYPLKLITNKEFYIVKNGEYYHLKVDVSGDKINVILLNERDEPSSEPSTLSVSRSRITPSTPQLQLQVPVTLRALLSITDYDGAFEPLFTPRTNSLEDVVSCERAAAQVAAVSVRARKAHAMLVPRELRLRDPRARPQAGYAPTPEAQISSAFLSVLKIYQLSGDVEAVQGFDPLYAFTFIRTFLNILIECFGEVTAPVLSDNFDIVHKLLEEAIDAALVGTPSQRP